MKAALNVVASFSVLDGWWVEGHLERVTGCAIGDEGTTGDLELEVAMLYDKLERELLPMYYGKPQPYAEVMRMAIALNGSFFNTQCMLRQYVVNSYSHRAELLMHRVAAVRV